MRVLRVMTVLVVTLAHTACAVIVSSTTDANPVRLAEEPTVMPAGGVPSAVVSDPDVADLPPLPDHRPVSQVDASEDIWQTLQRRPLRLPEVAPGETCPVTATSNAHGSPVLGFGPISPAFGPFADGDGIVRLQRLGVPEGDGWSWMKVPWFSNTDYRGPALIRGRQLDGEYELRFASDRQGVAPALRFPVAPTTLGTNLPEGWRFQPSSIGVRGPGCYALQIDGINFTRVLVFEVVP